jgi:hypothetical protein
MALVNQNHLVIVCAAHATDAHKAKMQTCGKLQTSIYVALQQSSCCFLFRTLFHPKEVIV